MSTWQETLYLNVEEEDKEDKEDEQENPPRSLGHCQTTVQPRLIRKPKAYYYS